MKFIKYKVQWVSKIINTISLNELLGWTLNSKISFRISTNHGTINLSACWQNFPGKIAGLI